MCPPDGPAYHEPGYWKPVKTTPAYYGVSLYGRTPEEEEIARRCVEKRREEQREFYEKAKRVGGCRL